MELTRELIAPDPDASFRIVARREPSFGFSWHHHREYELTCIVAGHGTRFVGDAIHAYEGADLVLLGPDLPHTWWAPGEDGAEHVAYCAQFDHAAIGDVLARPEGRRLHQLLARCGGGLAFPPALAPRIADLLAAMHRVPPLVRLGLLLEALGTLIDAEATAISSGTLPEADDPRVDRACRFVLEHLDQPIARGEVAAHVGLSPEAFSRFFKRRTGRTLTEYIHQLRVTQACDRLRSGDDTIAEIAFAVGFGNLANFNRVFKRLRRMTPRDYRRRWGS